MRERLNAILPALALILGVGVLACPVGTARDAPRENQSSPTASPSTAAAPPVPPPAPAPPPATEPSEGASSSDPVAVSLLELIATPERFKGRWVRLMGFAVLEFEGNAVYLHEEDYLHSLTRNGLWLDNKGGTLAQPNGPGYAIIEGQFDPDVHGHMDLFSGGLVHLQRLSPWAGSNRPKAPDTPVARRPLRPASTAPSR